MTLKGFVCPIEGKISFEDCLARAERHEDPNGIPSEVYRYIINQQEDRGTMVSPSAITGCMRKTYLQRTNDYWQAIDELWPASRGQLFHYALENNEEPGAIVEKRFYRTLPSGIVLSFKPDVIYPLFKELGDWKTTQSIPSPSGKFANGYPNHIEQLNVYRYGLAKPDNEEPIEINKIKITYMDMRRVRSVFPPVWPLEKTYDIIKDNAEILANAFETGEVPPVPREYPNYKLCNYCPEEVREKCSQIYEMNHKL